MERSKKGIMRGNDARFLRSGNSPVSRKAKFLWSGCTGRKCHAASFQAGAVVFIDSVGKDRKGKTIIRQIIEDRRFDTMEWVPLRELLRVVNGWLKTPLVTEEEIQKAWRQYPKESGELRERLAEWRERLRASVPKWLP